MKMSGPANILTRLRTESQNPFWYLSSHLYIKQLKMCVRYSLSLMLASAISLTAHLYSG